MGASGVISNAQVACELGVKPMAALKLIQTFYPQLEVPRRQGMKILRGVNVDALLRAPCFAKRTVKEQRFNSRETDIQLYQNFMKSLSGYCKQ